MDKVAGSQNDEFFTPPYAIEPILKFIPKDWIVWCPFDTEESHFVKILGNHGCKVVASHIINGQDFFEFEPDNYQVIVSNPPYSKKTEVLERLFILGKPFAMLLGVVGLFESQRRFKMFQNNDWQIMYLNKRIAFFKSFLEQKPSLNPPFSSVYLSKGLFPKQVIFEEIKKS